MPRSKAAVSFQYAPTSQSTLTATAVKGQNAESVMPLLDHRTIPAQLNRVSDNTSRAPFVHRGGLAGYLLCAALVTVALSPALANAEPMYVIQDVGTLGGVDPVNENSETKATGLTDSGDVVGRSFNSENKPRTFIYDGSSIEQACELQEPERVNGAGVILGLAQYKIKGHLHYRAASCQDQVQTQLSDEDGTAFVDINEADEMAGYTRPEGGIRHAVRRSPSGSLEFLGDLGGAESRSEAINQHGEVVGMAQLESGLERAFLYDAGGMRDLGALPELPRSIGWDINDSGDVAGASRTPCSIDTCYDSRGVIFRANGVIEDLGVLPGDATSAAGGINNHDEVVGQSDTDHSVLAADPKAFVWIDGTMYDLQEHIVGGTSLDLTVAMAINDRGQIAGYGETPSGDVHAFLLTPTALGKYTPELRYDSLETYRADAANEATDNFYRTETKQWSNALFDEVGGLVASSDPLAEGDTLSLSYLENRTGDHGDHIDLANHYTEDFQRLHADSSYANKVYGREVNYLGGDTVLQYWLFYYDNPWNILGVGEHEGDWEMVELLLDSAGTPVWAAYSQHDTGEYCSWSSVEHTASGRPIVYVAEGSHANYFRPGEYYLGGLVAYDVADGNASEGPIAPAVVDVSSTPKWLEWDGRWGGSDGSGGGSASPQGPRWQPDMKWDNPSAWATSSERIACRSEEGGTGAMNTLSSGLTSEGHGIPAPDLTIHQHHNGVEIHYRFDALPTNRLRRPWEILTSTDSAGTKSPPLTLRHRIAGREGSIIQPVGRGAAPYQLSVAVRSAAGARRIVYRQELQP